MEDEKTRLMNLESAIQGRLDNGANENTADFEAFLKSIKQSLANAE